MLGEARALGYLGTGSSSPVSPYQLHHALALSQARSPPAMLQHSTLTRRNITVLIAKIRGQISAILFNAIFIYSVVSEFCDSGTNTASKRWEIMNLMVS